MTKRSFRAIEGLRFILSSSVILLHTVTTLIYYYSSSSEGRNDDEGAVMFKELKAASWLGFVKMFAVQVDMFFVISGFLLSYAVLTSSGSDSAQSTSSVIANVASVIAKKLAKLLPFAIISALLSSALDDINSAPIQLISRVLSFEMNEIEMPIALVVSWSNRVEIIASSALAVLLLVPPTGRLLASREYGRRICLLLIAASLIPPSMVYLRHPGLTAKALMGQSLSESGHVPLYMSMQRARWLGEKYFAVDPYPERFRSCEEEPYLGSAYWLDGGLSAPIRAVYAKELYLSTPSRLTPFLVGLYTAQALAGDRENYRGPGERLLLHRVYLLITMILLVLPTYLGYVNSRSSGPAAAEVAADATSRGFIDYAVVVLIRPVMSVAFAYLLYRSVVHTDHHLHLSATSTILSVPQFQTLGSITYGVYIIHFRVLYDVLFYCIRPETLLRMINQTTLLTSASRSLKGFVMVLLYGSIVSFLSNVISMFVGSAVEIHVQRFLHRHVICKIKNV